MNLKHAFTSAQFICVLIFYLFFCKNAFGQKDNINIIPLSPNAAEMTRYGEIPVSNFTGIPNIGIPIYTVTSGELSLPITLSYHAGGNKVESIASWVGLSWSLGSLPSISRSVNGQPDDGVNGYFSKFQGKSIRQFMEHYTGGYDPVVDEFMDYVKSEHVDTEPDAFNFSINGKSGKFYYNQDVDRFVCSPYSNIKITYIGQSFIITDDDGTKYFFEDRETSSTGASGPGMPVATSWVITKIMSANQRDAIFFDYVVENQMTQSLVANIKYLFTNNSFCNNLPPNITGGQLTAIVAKTLSSIRFQGGHLDFVKKNVEREDLYGGYALDRIKLFSANDNLIRQFGFNYKYLTGTGGLGCLINDNYKSNKWMFLTDFSEIAVDNASVQKHSFEYDEFHIPPCRNSPAQDFWGYYNGKLSNTDLVPTVNVPNTSLVMPGADRDVDPSFTQFGILKQIHYPTGGYSFFDYENNDSFDPYLPKTYVTESPYVAQEEPVLDGQELPVYKEYETTFVINNQRDGHLNGGNPNGGAFVSGDIKNLGVPFGSAGASIIIRRITPSAPIIQLVPSGSFQNYYLPNGTYSLKATFAQDPPNYQNFWVLLSYDKIDSSRTNAYLGGLRIKKVQSHPGGSAAPIVNNYSYVNDYGQSASSGVSFLKPLFNYSYEHVFGSGNCLSMLFTVKSFSNQSQVSTSGSYAGYKRVFIKSNAPSQTGLTSYAYSTLKDELYNDQWPFPPPQSMEAFRGQLLENAQYKWQDNSFKIVKRSKMDYVNSLLDVPRNFAMKVSTEFVGQWAEDNSRPKGEVYEFALEWSALAKQTDRLYDQQDTTRYVETITDFEYDEPYKQLLKKTVTGSNTKTTVVKNYYPYNLSLSGSAEDARQWLITNNSLSTMLKKEILVDNQLVDASMTNYKRIDGSDLVKPYETVSYLNMPGAEKSVFKDYEHTYGNLVEFYHQNGPKTSYLWGYKGKYPVVEVKNSDYLTVKSALTSTDLSSIDAVNPSKAIIDAIVSTLKTALPYAQISSYVYKPLVGLEAATDVKGLSTYYEYDDFQRLFLIRDRKNNIVKQYNYNYSPDLLVPAPGTYYNVAKSGLFVKNNCGTGYTGSAVTYQVPLGKYLSTISQVDADQRAEYDINTNGQGYANQNGTCTANAPTIYTRLEFENISNVVYGNIQNFIGDLFIRFYSDPNCTVPFTLTGNMDVKLNDHLIFDIDESDYESTYTALAGNAQLALGSTYLRDKILYYDPNGESTNIWHLFSLLNLPGSNYVVKPTIGDNYLN
jgi:hypothetical protein